MADAIDDLETMLLSAVATEDTNSLLKTIDKWRQYHGGNRAYIAKHSADRRQLDVKRLFSEGKTYQEIADQLGLSERQIRRIALTKKSSYL